MNERFCQICRGPWPDGHKDWCPILTGEPQPGAVSQQQFFHGSQLQQSQQNLMSQQGFQEIEFVDGPLDGNNPVHPLQNSILRCQDDTSGYYMYLADGRYHWIPERQQ